MTFAERMRRLGSAVGALADRMDGRDKAEDRLADALDDRRMDEAKALLAAMEQRWPDHPDTFYYQNIYDQLTEGAR